MTVACEGVHEAGHHEKTKERQERSHVPTRCSDGQPFMATVRTDDGAISGPGEFCFSFRSTDQLLDSKLDVQTLYQVIVTVCLGNCACHGSRVELLLGNLVAYDSENFVLEVGIYLHRQLAILRMLTENSVEAKVLAVKWYCLKNRSWHKTLGPCRHAAQEVLKLQSQGSSGSHAIHLQSMELDF